MPSASRSRSPAPSAARSGSKAAAILPWNRPKLSPPVDVNTGRFVGKHNLEDTIFKTNLEAVKEIAFQLRLRNIGGLIVIDFIDMEKEVHREKVHSALEEALRPDKSKTNILKISELGLDGNDPQTGTREYRPDPL